MSLEAHPPLIGAPAPRIDGLAKVTGAAVYGADHALDGLAHAALALSPIARGRLVAVNDAAARALPGVLDVLTGLNCAPLASDRIHFAGQIVALVVAESLPAAQEAAAALRFEWAAEALSAGFDDAGARTVEAKPAGGEAGVEVGDVDAAWAEAPFKVNARHETPTQHHNPLGIKGLGELGISGANAAVANAVFHATGVRVRRLPIRLDDLLGKSEFLR